MKVLKIGIASLDEMRARTMAIARGELKPRRDDPKIWFTSAESIAKVLSQSNRSLLREIVRTRPQSLAELAEKTGRKVSNLSRTLKKMESYGLVTLKSGRGRQMRPEVHYHRIEVMMPLDRAA
jgi:predicted transcriptional regulator